ncbi:MAG: type I CRISPR-associated protein Cas7, partial [Desulfobacterium sp.]|nr:type I CRISPR-associated protein Cas7 [Desulfobacterium sp.]
TIQSAFSLEPITPDSLQITKSVNLETNEKEPDKKGADTMGMKHRVDKGIYVTYGAINTQLAAKTTFTDENAKKIKLALQTLFVNDVSSARPEGSMEVIKVLWWNHNSPSGQYSSARVHGALRELLKKDKNGTYDTNELRNKLKNLELEELDQLEGEELQKLYK